MMGKIEDFKDDLEKRTHKKTQLQSQVELLQFAISVHTDWRAQVGKKGVKY